VPELIFPGMTFGEQARAILKAAHEIVSPAYNCPIFVTGGYGIYKVTPFGSGVRFGRTLWVYWDPVNGWVFTEALM